VTSNLSPIKMRHVKPCIMLMRYGPGVAAQVNSFLTRALGIPKRTLGSLCTRKMLATHGTIDSARSSRDSGSPPTSHRSNRPWRVLHRP